MITIRSILLALIAVSLYTDVLALTENLKVFQSQFWGDYNFKYQRHPKYSLGGDIGYRTDLDNKNWRTLYMRPQARYYFNNDFNIFVTAAYFFTHHSEANNRREIRFAQQVNYKWPVLDWVEIKHSMRLEEQFFRSFRESIPDWSSTRGRYKIAWQSNSLTRSKVETSLYLLGNFEIFFPIGKVPDFFITRKRLMLGLGHRIQRGFKYELQYIAEGSRSIGEEVFEPFKDIIRVRLFQTI